MSRTGKVWGERISQNVVWYVVKACCEKAGLRCIAPHDLRRTCAKLCHSSGGELEQIHFLLEIDTKYEFKYSSVLLLLAQLVWESRISVDELHGLSEDKRKCVRDDTRDSAA